MSALEEDPRVTAGRAVVAKVLSERLDAVAAELRARLENLLAPDEKVRAQLPDGTVVGSVARAKPAQRGAVTDPEALLAWVQEHAPEEIERSVRPAFLRKLTDSAKRHGVAVLPDGSIVPGVEAVPGSAAYRPTPSDDGRALILQRLDQEGTRLLEEHLPPRTRDHVEELP